jgi:hypothetical protein
MLPSSSALPSVPARLTTTPTRSSLGSSSAPTPPTTTGGGGTRGDTPCCHHDSRLLGPTNLAPSPVHPTATDASQSILSWNIGVRRVGSGRSSTTANPDRHILRPKGPPSHLPGPWSAVTTMEEGTANQASSPSSRLETSAPRSRFWRGAAVHANLFLGCTDFCGGIRC